MDDAVIEITAPIELAIVDDRLHFVCVSGKRRWPFSITFHKATNAAMCTATMLAEHRSTAANNVREIKRG